MGTRRLERIGRYEVIETLARGGMGVVYKARDPLIDRVVAIKTLGLGLSPIEAEAFHKRFAREAKSAGRLNHPNIVTIHDMGESDDGAYIAMEFLEGRSLRDVLDSGVVLPPQKVAALVLEVAEGLGFAHRHGVVHCDIKPANIMVLDGGGVKITDFGIAMLPTGSRTFAGNVLGSPRYISPEQIVGRPIDARSDIFALGAVLYEMLTGVPPFAGDTIDEILYQVINAKPEPPSQRNRAIPAAFDAIVERAMAKDAGDRYQHVAEMAKALRALASAESGVVAALPSAPPRRAASPGMTTVTMPPLDAQTSESAPAPAGTRRAAALALPAGLLLLALGWARTALQADDDAVVATTGAPSTTAASTQPIAAAREPALIPPLDTAPREPMPLVTETTPDRKSPAPATSAPPKPSASMTSGGPVRIGFAIAPWGEVYVDGRKRGVAPPLTELRLPPGRYEVEIRNTTFAPHRQTIELTADAPLRIKHKFQ